MSRKKSPPSPVHIGGTDVEIVTTYKYLSVQLDSKLEWSTNAEGLSRLYFLKRLKSFDVCNKMLQMFHQSVVVSTVFSAVVCWGDGIKAKDANRLNKLIEKPESAVGTNLASVQELVRDRMQAKLLAITDQDSHSLHNTLDKLKSTFSIRPIQPRCLKERCRKSFLPAAIKFITHLPRQTSLALVR